MHTSTVRQYLGLHVLVKVFKVLRIQFVFHLGLVGGGLSVHAFPGDARKKGVGLNMCAGVNK
jgi:hypothetical protein